ARSQRKSTLIIRVKWRLSICCHRRFVSFDVWLSKPNHGQRGRSQMRRVHSFIAAGTISLLSTAAFAADMPIMPPPAYAPPPPQEFGGWYLRGDIGFSNQKVNDLHYGRESAYSQLTSFNQQSSFDTAGIFGVGVGYQLNNWF